MTGLSVTGWIRPVVFNVAAIGFLGLVARDIWLDPSFAGAAQGTVGFAAAAFCGMLGNIQHFESFQANQSGFTAKMREAESIIEDAKATVISLHHLAALVGSFLIDAQEGSGRLQGAITQIHKRDNKARLIEQLKTLSLPSEQIEKILRADQFWISLDYVMALLKPVGSGEKLRLWAEAFRSEVLSSDEPLTPDDCEAFMNKYGIDDVDRRNLLKSYRYYINTNEHIDPSLVE